MVMTERELACNFYLTLSEISPTIMNKHASEWINIQMNKPARQEAILGLVAQQRIASQEDLQRALNHRGIAAGQATLSRDIHALGLVKTEEGYAVRQGGAPSEPVLPPVARLV